MVAEFMTYYHYTLDQALAMYAVSFFALLSAMYRLRGVHGQELAYTTYVAHAGGDILESYMKNMEKQAKGARGLLDEVRIVRNMKK